MKLFAISHHILRVCSCLVDGCRRAELVGSATNGAEAIDVVHTARPDVLLLDEHMPIVDGLEAAVRVIEELPGIRIVFLTEDDSVPTRDKCMAVGASQSFGLGVIRKLPRKRRGDPEFLGCKKSPPLKIYP